MPDLDAGPRELLQLFNDTAVDFTPLRSVVDEVARHAALTPDALAVADEHESLSYRELDSRAAQLARVLRLHGARPETCVTLCVQASVGYVVGALGVMKAGAAYVPVDPDYPQERIALILDDTDPVAVLVDATTPPEVLEANRDRVLHLDEPPKGLIASAEEGVRPELSSLAYIVYTSGSTGRPKGVEIEHRSLANLAHAQAYASSTTPQDRLAQTAAPAFDATVMEVWHPLVAGASLHIAPHELRRDPRRLVEWFTEQDITMSMVATALVSLLFDVGGLYHGLTVRRLTTGGAALLTRPAADAPFPLVNMYGPTETTVVATQGVVPPVGDKPPTIGRPLANTRIYVLDPDREPVGIGVPGEIWLGGVQVARGYRGRPDLTAERFLPDPFGLSADARMYRTGDLGCWTETGEIDFHGRVDDQIAIRGYRIEPGEVEAALTGVPAVVDAVVVAVDHGRRGQQLAAYYTSSDPDLATADVRAHARSILPEYMVPTTYQRLDSFPMTPNGKVDRKNLPAPVQRRADLDSAYVAPRNDRERLVTEVFADILELDEVGAEDDFFALGGDSLDAVACGLRVEQALGVDEIPIRLLYAHPTAASLLPALDGLADDSIDWATEATPALDGLQPLPRTDTTRPRGVFLTGASGFLGPHLLAALAAETRTEGGRVLALVRAPDPAQGLDRLRSALLDERRDLGADWDRVEVVVGDLGLPRFGLDEAAFDELAARTDAVLHNGAYVHHLHGYRQLRAANVGGTQEVLRLARRAGNVPVRYVSSMSTTLEQRDGAMAERPDGETVPPLGTGYGESKWVAERLVLGARELGVPTQSVRLPRAMTALRSGATSTHDAVVRLLRGCLDLGCYPQWSGWEPWSPVDLVADVLSASPFDLGAGESGGAPAIAYPPASIAGLTRFFRSVAAYGYPLRAVPVTEWRAALAASAHNAAAPVAEEFGLLDDQLAHSFGDVPPGRSWRVSPLLPGPTAPPVDNEYVWRMLDYLVSTGYLTRPQPRS